MVKTRPKKTFSSDERDYKPWMKGWFSEVKGFYSGWFSISCKRVTHLFDLNRVFGGGGGGVENLEEQG